MSISPHKAAPSNLSLCRRLAAVSDISDNSDISESLAIACKAMILLMTA